MRLEPLGIDWGKGVFRRTKRISFELSNICNLAPQHVKCPLHGLQEKHILRETIVEGVLETCRQHQFEGVIAFHMYNEPGIDPRLVHFMRRVRHQLPRARIYLLTNGWYLNQLLAEEFVGHGLDYLDVSAYSEVEYVRLQRLRLPIRVRVIRQQLDDRLGLYDHPGEGEARGGPCYCPLYELSISCQGLLCLCPYDWRRQHVFGDLNRETLEQALARPEAWDMHLRLAGGRRELPVCRACLTSRGEPHPSDAAPPAG